MGLIECSLPLRLENMTLSTNLSKMNEGNYI